MEQRGVRGSDRNRGIEGNRGEHERTEGFSVEQRKAGEGIRQEQGNRGIEGNVGEQSTAARIGRNPAF